MSDETGDKKEDVLGGPDRGSKSRPRFVYDTAAGDEGREKDSLRMTTTSPSRTVLPRAADQLTVRQSPVRSTAPHFGPFVRGSALDKIQVRVHSSGSQWYFNDFFAGHPDSGTYARYFPGQVLPANAAPAISYVPGGNWDGGNALAFELHAIRYSSRYGGSVQLNFRQPHDTHYEFKKGNIRWDTHNLELRLFVTPRVDDLPRGPGNRGRIQVEIQFEDATAYELDGQKVVVSADKRIADLRERVREVERSAQGSDSFRQTASRFVDGWLHTQVATEIGTHDVVDSMILSDDFFDVRTHVGRPHFAIQFRIENPIGNGWSADVPGDMFGSEEFRVRIQVQYLDHGGGWVVLPRRAYDVPAGEDTPWYPGPIGILNLNFVPARLEVWIRFREKDLLDDETKVTIHTVFLDSQALWDSHAQGNYGVVAEQTQVAPSGHSLIDEDFIPVDYTLRARLLLALR